MDAAGLLVFAAAYLLAVASPGPGVTALVARVLGRGTSGAPAYIAGFVLGDLFWFTVAALGLAALAQSYAGLFAAVRWLGVGYLLFLAWRMWRAPAAAIDVAPDRAGAERPLTPFLGSLTLTLGNPKAAAFFLALLPTIVDLGTLTPLGMAEIAGVIALILTGVLAGYAIAAERARRFIASPERLRLVNRLGSAAIAGAAATVAARG